MIAEKYFVVAIDRQDYHREIARRRLPPGACFQALTHAEALATVERNRRWGIVPEIVCTAAWTQANRPLRKRAAA